MKQWLRGWFRRNKTPVELLQETLTRHDRTSKKSTWSQHRAYQEHRSAQHERELMVRLEQAVQSSPLVQSVKGTLAISICLREYWEIALYVPGEGYLYCFPCPWDVESLITELESAGHESSIALQQN